MKTAVYFGSREIYADMIPASKSLLINSDVDKIFLLIEDDDFPHLLPSSGIIETINIRDFVPRFYDMAGPNFCTQWTYIGLIRTALTKVFPKMDKVLSIDCDTIVDRDISELWDIPLDGYYFAATKEPLLTDQLGILYTNVGITMMNLKKMRDDGKDDELINALNKQYFLYVCQDAMNQYCQGNILELSSDYNVCQFTEHTENPKIRHYAGERVHWRNNSLVQKYRDIPWSEIRK